VGELKLRLDAEKRNLLYKVDNPFGWLLRKYREIHRERLAAGTARPLGTTPRAPKGDGVSASA
jgi:hypothetical protein